MLKITMDRGEIKIALRPQGFWARLLDQLRGIQVTEAPAHRGTKVDLTLVSRLASRHVKGFVESIDTYQLLSPRVVQVLSRYRMPDHDGLREQLPFWLSERIRFGVVAADGRDFRYAELRAMTMRWTPEETEIEMHLAEPIAPGTRAFIAAYLGDGSDTQALRELPFSSLHGI